MDLCCAAPSKKKKKTKENAEKHGKKERPSNSQFGMRVTPPLYPQSPRKEKEKTVKNVLSNKLPDFITVK